MEKLRRIKRVKSKKIQFLIDGKLTTFGQLCVSLSGVTIAVASIAYASSKWLFVFGFVVGVLMVGFVGVSAKAQVLGLRPFTSDPLGWRKAKSTYTENQAVEVDPARP
jgi:hypothetical protein